MKKHDMPPLDIDYLSLDERKPRIYNKRILDYLLSYDTTKYPNPFSSIRDFFSLTERITSSTIRKEIYIYLFKNLGASVPVIAQETGLSISSIYREIRRLVSDGFVDIPVPPDKLIRGQKGKPVTIYALSGLYTIDDLHNATQKDRERRIPFYTEVRRIRQLILEEYIEPRKITEISYKDLIDYCKQKSRKYQAFDLAKYLGNDLHDIGIKVWR